MISPGPSLWPQRFGRALRRVDVWILIATVAGMIITT
jgi:hypothetical protein